MRNKIKRPAIDADNPEWTEEDFGRAKPAHEVLPPQVLTAFKKTRGPQRLPTKVPVAIRLSREVVDHFKAGGKGWQSRIDEALKRIVWKPRRRAGGARKTVRSAAAAPPARGRDRGR
jgi:uncharacterized protein (DUF4415 family)